MANRGTVYLRISKVGGAVVRCLVWVLMLGIPFAANAGRKMDAESRRQVELAEEREVVREEIRSFMRRLDENRQQVQEIEDAYKRLLKDCTYDSSILEWNKRLADIKDDIWVLSRSARALERRVDELRVMAAKMPLRRLGGRTIQSDALPKCHETVPALDPTPFELYFGLDTVETVLGQLEYQIVERE